MLTFVGHIAWPEEGKRLKEQKADFQETQTCQKVLFLQCAGILIAHVDGCLCLCRGFPLDLLANQV